jgi:hypothetical protein
VLKVIALIAVAVKVGPVVPIAVAVVAIRPTVGSVGNLHVSSFCPTTAAARPVPAGATVWGGARR